MNPPTPKPSDLPAIAALQSQPNLKTAIVKRHWKRHFQFLRIEACCRKNEAEDWAIMAKECARYHRSLAVSLTKKP